jgi:tRNA dimethylallyltransferase
LGELRAAHALGQPRYRALTLVLDVPLAPWRSAMAERVRGMLGRGWIGEVQGLLDRYAPELKPLRSVGYRQIVQGLEQRWKLDETETRVVHATRLYGKRQRNWFRTDPSVDLRIDAEAAFEARTLTAIGDHLGKV